MFDVRGLIQLGGNNSAEITGITFPKAVMEIPVHQRARHVHFLHAAAWHAPVGTKIGEYVIHYDGGKSLAIALRYGLNTIDWWRSPEDEAPAEVEVVWTGENERTRSLGIAIQLCRYTWDNPSPESAIESIDFVSEVVASAPLLVAVTID